MKKLLFCASLIALACSLAFADGYVMDLNENYSDAYSWTSESDSFNVETDGLTFYEGNFDFMHPYVPSNVEITSSNSVSLHMVYSNNDTPWENAYMYLSLTGNSTYDAICYKAQVKENGIYSFDLWSPYAYAAKNATEYTLSSDLLSGLTFNTNSISPKIAFDITSPSDVFTAFPPKTINDNVKVVRFAITSGNTVVPEPATYVYGAMGLISLIGLRRKITK